MFLSLKGVNSGKGNTIFVIFLVDLYKRLWKKRRYVMYCTWCVNGIALIGYVHKIAKPNCLKRFGSNILYTVATNTWLTVLRITNDQRTCSICHYPVLSSFMIYHLVCNKSNTRGGTCGAGTAYTSGAQEFTLGFQWSLCCLIFSFMCNVL